MMASSEGYEEAYFSLKGNSKDKTQLREFPRGHKLWEFLNGPFFPWCLALHIHSFRTS